MATFSSQAAVAIDKQMLAQSGTGDELFLRVSDYVPEFAGAADDLRDKIKPRPGGVAILHKDVRPGALSRCEFRTNPTCRILGT